MRRPSVILLTLAFLTILAPPAHAETLEARNAAFLWDRIGAADPAEPTTMPDGRVIPLAQAIEETVLRLGNVDLAALAGGAVLGPDTYVGDMWLLAIGYGGCTSTMILQTPVPTVPAAPQAWVYSGGVGTMSGDAISLTIIDWTTKETAFYANVHWEARGHMDFFCFSFGGLYLAFPFIDGIVTVG